MRVLLSYVPADKEFAAIMRERLANAGIEVIDLGESPERVRRITSADADWAIVLLSGEYLFDREAQEDLERFKQIEGTKGRRFIYPIRLDDSEVPLVIIDRVPADARGIQARSVVVSYVVELLSGIRKGKEAPASPAQLLPNRESEYIQHLREAFNSGKLTLICGAGISIDAGIPDWNTLIQRLLLQFSEKGDNPLTPEMARAYQREFAPSPLILARRLKNNYPETFLRVVRDQLYRTEILHSPAIDAIVDLCRPSRTGKSLHCVITFNFDDLIEQALTRQRVEHQSVYSDNQVFNESKELPVYHVHGFLPRDGEPDSQQEFVFSDDAYHAQFDEPFSWSNLTLLNHLREDTCLFVGLSMTDPNLRRLLDVWRRRKRGPHYLVKKRRVTSRGADTENKVAVFADTIELADALSLELNVIEIDQYDELPALLRKIRL